MRGNARDILILQRITYFSTIGSEGLKRRNNGRNKNDREMPNMRRQIEIPGR